MVTCLGSGETRPKAALLRIVNGPDGLLYPDFSGNLPGEKGYIQPTRPLLEELAAGLAPRVQAALEGRLAQTLGLMRKGGQAAPGLDGVAFMAKKGMLQGVFIATDAGADSLEKGTRAANKAKASIWRPLTKAQMCKAMGLNACAIIAIAEAAPTRQALQYAAWLDGFDEQPPSEQTDLDSE